MCPKCQEKANSKVSVDLNEFHPSCRETLMKELLYVPPESAGS
jgi:hypothetical protein